MRTLLALAVALLLPGLASAQMPGQLCSATYALRANCGVTDAATILVRFTDATVTQPGASVAIGGGANEVIALCESGTCVVAADDSAAAFTAAELAADSVAASEIATRAVGADEMGAMVLSNVIACGDLPNNTTNYTSPISGFPGAPLYDAGLTGTDLDYDLAGAGCAAQDDTTEANADEVMFTTVAFNVLGLYCRVSSSGANGVTFSARSAAADLTPDVTCTIATGTTECRALTASTTDVAANATFAVQAISTEDLSAQDYWCMATIALQ